MSFRNKRKKNNGQPCVYLSDIVFYFYKPMGFKEECVVLKVYRFCDCGEKVFLLEDKGCAVSLLRCQGCGKPVDFESSSPFVVMNNDRWENRGMTDSEALDCFRIGIRVFFIVDGDCIESGLVEAVNKTRSGRVLFSVGGGVYCSDQLYIGNHVAEKQKKLLSIREKEKEILRLRTEISSLYGELEFVPLGGERYEFRERDYYSDVSC